MARQLIDIDDDLLARAAEVMGTDEPSETVTKALDDVVRRHQREKFLELLASDKFDDLRDPEIMAGAWRTFAVPPVDGV